MNARPRSFARRPLAALTVVALAVVAGACGSSDDESSDPPASEVTVADENDPATTESESVGDDTEASASDELQQNGPIEVEGEFLPQYVDDGDDPVVGTAAPVVRGQSFDGSEIVLGEPTDNATLVVYLAHWCPHCNEEVPELVQLEAEGRIPEGVDVVGVSTAVAPDRLNFPPSDWIEQNDWTWPVIADDEDLSAINAVGGSSFPFSVVLDTDGTVLARRAGQASGDETVAFLEDALTRSSS